VTVKLGDQSATATADQDGNWLAKLPASDEKNATTLTITGADGKTITVHDVLLGDVWDASGQSNMEWPVKVSNNAAKEIESANYPQIRFFRFPKTVSTQPTKEFFHGGKWEVCTPQSAGDFSAVGYFFARELNQHENVPIGIIDNSWGGMPAEAFTSAEALAADPDLAPLLEVKRKAMTDKDAKAKHEKALAEWQEKYMVKDPGNKGADKGWARPEFDDSAWKTMEEPVKWESQGQKIDGAVWFRRTIDVPAEWEGKELSLNLGLLDDFDTTYFNGKQIGAIGADNKLAWATERKYKVPGELVKGGKATIATRIFDQWGDGGFSGPAASMHVGLAGDATKALPLAGPWRYEIEYAKPAPDPLPWPPAAPPSATAPNMASNLFNGMVNPVIPYAIKGVIWYQGESNADRG